MQCVTQDAFQGATGTCALRGESCAPASSGPFRPMKILPRAMGATAPTQGLYHFGVRSPAIVTATRRQSIPMLAKLLVDLDVNFAGLDSWEALDTRALLGGQNGAFFVDDARVAEDARGRRVIPNKEFVEAYGVRTVFGMGGAYFEGTLALAIVFTSEVIDRLVTEPLSQPHQQLQDGHEHAADAGPYLPRPRGLTAPTQARRQPGARPGPCATTEPLALTTPSRRRNTSTLPAVAPWYENRNPREGVRAGSGLSSISVDAAFDGGVDQSRSSRRARVDPMSARKCVHARTERARRAPIGDRDRNRHCASGCIGQGAIERARPEAASRVDLELRVPARLGGGERDREGRSKGARGNDAVWRRAVRPPQLHVGDRRARRGKPRDVGEADPLRAQETRERCFREIAGAVDGEERDDWGRVARRDRVRVESDRPDLDGVSEVRLARAPGARSAARVATAPAIFWIGREIDARRARAAAAAGGSGSARRAGTARARPPMHVLVTALAQLWPQVPQFVGSDATSTHDAPPRGPGGKTSPQQAAPELQAGPPPQLHPLAIHELAVFESQVWHSIPPVPQT